MSIKNQIEEMVANGNLDAAIRLIKNVKVNDSKLQSDLISLSGRYSRWKDEYHSGISKDEQELNRIMQGILFYTGKYEALIEIRQGKSLTNSNSIEFSKKVSNHQVILDINALWTSLFSDLRSTIKESEKRLDLFGITLYAAWGQLKPWLNEEKTKEWIINIRCLSPTIAKSELSRLLPSSWAIDAENKTNQIKEYIKDYNLELKRKNIEINLFHYDFLPTIHGWKLGSGKIYFSITEWSKFNDKLGYNSHPYEIIHQEDESEIAQIKRNWFNNWLQRAKKNTIETAYNNS